MENFSFPSIFPSLFSFSARSPFPFQTTRVFPFAFPLRCFGLLDGPCVLAVRLFFSFPSLRHFQVSLLNIDLPRSSFLSLEVLRAPPPSPFPSLDPFPLKGLGQFALFVRRASYSLFPSFLWNSLREVLFFVLPFFPEGVLF